MNRVIIDGSIKPEKSYKNMQDVLQDYPNANTIAFLPKETTVNDVHEESLVDSNEEQEENVST